MAAEVLAPPQQLGLPHLSDGQGGDGQHDKVVENSDTNILTKKIADVLRNSAYDERTVERVSSLVVANTAEVIMQIPESAQDIADVIEGQLLNKDRLAQMNLHINSNEPVLLTEVDESCAADPVSVRRYKDEVLDVLRMRGIRPVRAYIRIADAEASGPMKIMLLNVVNTEIGGPSMIQLLDSAFHHGSWRGDLVSKEAWSGDDLLWRDEAWPQAANGGDLTHSNNDAHETVNSYNRVEDVPASPMLETAGKAESKTSVPEAATLSNPRLLYTDVEAVPEEKNEDEPNIVEHPAMKELRDQEAGRVQIQHPTWSRDDDRQGLLDIITSQSAGVKDTDPISVISHEPGNTDDEFEMIEEA